MSVTTIDPPELPDRSAIHGVLVEAQRLGHVGPGPLDPQIDRSLALCLAFPVAPAGPVVDLGSGGGLPGLVMAAAWPHSRWVLLDGRALRATFLRWAVEELGWTSRVEVIGERAERVGRGARRASAEVVVARGFGAPAVTAECAAPLLRVGGTLVVTEPPGGRQDRWPPAPLAELGLVPERTETSPIAFQVLRQERPCPTRFPRKAGTPAKRLLF
jgi:16S rRNA (guanine527-N7)-methyltransferase